MQGLCRFLFSIFISQNFYHNCSNNNNFLKLFSPVRHVQFCIFGALSGYNTRSLEKGQNYKLLATSSKPERINWVNECFFRCLFLDLKKEFKFELDFNSVP